MHYHNDELGLLTIVELKTYIADIRDVLSIDEQATLKVFLAEHPETGDLIKGSGGVRKLRWKRQGMGKSGGARIIYYYHNQTIPLFLITAYASLTTKLASDLIDPKTSRPQKEKGETQ